MGENPPIFHWGTFLLMPSHMGGAAAASGKQLPLGNP